VTKIAFDNDRYLDAQREAILERLGHFEDKLYLEFEGRMAFDRHAERVLPGYDANAKLHVLQSIGEQVEVLICVNARALTGESNLRASLGGGRPADSMVLQAVDGWKAVGVDAGTVVINRFDGQREAKNLRDRLEIMGARVYTQPELGGFPADLDGIVGRNGWIRFPRIVTRRPIVLVTGLGIESGKHTTCLSLLHRDRRDKIRSGYARWMTFPVPQLAPGHPVNAAFDAAAADVNNRSLVDPFHLDATGDTAVTSSRERMHFGLVRGILGRILGADDPMEDFRSPTELSVNAVIEGFTDEDAIKEASGREIIRRWYRYNEGLVAGGVEPETMERMDRVLTDLGLNVEQRDVVLPARRAAEEARHRGKGHKGVFCGASIQLADGKMITGNNSQLLHAESAVLIRAIKVVAGIDEETELLPTPLIDRIRTMKRNVMNEPATSLSLAETLIALSIASKEEPHVEQALEALPQLRGCEMHITHQPSPGDASGLRKVGLYYTTDARMTYGDRGY